MPLNSNQHCEIVLVDDDEDDFFFLNRALQHYSHQITLRQFTSGNRLFDYLKTAESLPSLILMDIHLPGEDGLEVLSTLKQQVVANNIPVVIWSGSIADEEVNGFYQAGACSVIVKSNDQTSLETAMTNLCSYWLDTVRLPIYPKQPHC